VQDLKKAVITSVEHQGVSPLPDVPSNGSLDCGHGLTLREGRPDILDVAGEGYDKSREEVVPDFTCTVTSNN
jgi:hypothetical protein